MPQLEEVELNYSDVYPMSMSSYITEVPTLYTYIHPSPNGANGRETSNNWGSNLGPTGHCTARFQSTSHQPRQSPIMVSCDSRNLRFASYCTIAKDPLRLCNNRNTRVTRGMQDEGSHSLCYLVCQLQRMA